MYFDENFQMEKKAWKLMIAFGKNEMTQKICADLTRKVYFFLSLLVASSFSLSVSFFLSTFLLCLSFFHRSVFLTFNLPSGCLIFFFIFQFSFYLFTFFHISLYLSFSYFSTLMCCMFWPVFVSWSLQTLKIRVLAFLQRFH